MRPGRAVAGRTSGSAIGRQRERAMPITLKFPFLARFAQGVVSRLSETEDRPEVAGGHHPVRLDCPKMPEPVIRP